MKNQKNLTKKLVVFAVCAACALTVFALPALAATDAEGLTNMTNNVLGLLWMVLQTGGIIAMAAGACLFILDLFGQGVGQKIAHIGMMLGGLVMYNMEAIIASFIGG